VETTELKREQAPLLGATCVVCRKPRFANPLGHLPRRPLCGDCLDKIYVHYVGTRERVLRHLPDGPDAATHKQRAAAFEQALRGGRIYEQIVALLRSRRPVGRPQPLASDFAIEVMFACGFSDEWIRWELDEARREGELTIPSAGPPPLPENYVRRRRRLSLLPMSQEMRERERRFQRDSQGLNAHVAA
jgi:hypothetical protein